jgi:thymidine phosphorylase
MHVSLGQEIDKGNVMLDIHAESSGELAYALEYARRSPDIIEVEISS